MVACERGTVRISETASDGTDGIVPDLVEAPWCETVARASPPLRDTSAAGRGRGHPRLGPAAGAARPRPADPGGRGGALGSTAGPPTWSSVSGTTDPSTSTCAGTARTPWSPAPPAPASRSCCRPWWPRWRSPTARTQLTFVLVDYKGGCAFKDCARLPHTVGMVTDLDNHLVEPGAGVAGRRAAPSRAPARRARGQGHRGLLGLQRSRPDLPPMPAAGDRDRRVRQPGRGAAGLRARAWSTSPSAAGRSASTWCSPPSGPAAWSPPTSAPTPTCASRCG